MEKDLILITGSVMNSNSDSIDTYSKLISMIDTEKFDVSSPLDTMQFTGTDAQRYERAIQMLSKTRLMIAEMSSVSTGQGMEIQQAAILGIPILVIARENSKVSGLVKGCPVVRNIVFYDDIDLIKDDIDSFIKEETNEKHSNHRR